MDTHKLPNIVEAALPPHHRATGGQGGREGRPAAGPLTCNAQTTTCTCCTAWLSGLFVLPMSRAEPVPARSPADLALNWLLLLLHSPRQAFTLPTAPPALLCSPEEGSPLPQPLAHRASHRPTVPATDPPSAADPSFCCISPCAVTWREGRFHNPWDTWQERSFSDVLKWNRERRK